MAATKKTPLARLDEKGTAEPKTRLVGHARAGACLGPGSTTADALEDVETGARTALTIETTPEGAARLMEAHARGELKTLAGLPVVSVEPEAGRMHEIEGFGSLSARHIVYERELERLAWECEEHLVLIANVRKAHPETELVLKYVTDQIQARLDVILKLSKG